MGRAASGRQVDREPGPASRQVLGADRATMSIDDPAGDGQSQPGATRGRPGAPVEALEEVWQARRNDPLALVLALAGGAAGRRPQADQDARSRRAVAQSIVDQEADQLPAAGR